MKWGGCGDGDKAWRVGKITAKQRKLPIKQIWSNALFLERVDTGWRPETDDE